jgi:predicted ATPase/DNA-binding winged helix-turn-helix (wHTH) protein
MIGAYESGVWLVDLTPLCDLSLVPSAVATVLGLEIRTEDPRPSLVAALRDCQVLLLLESGIEQSEASCLTPELVRLKRQLSLLQGMPEAERSAEALCRRALHGRARARSPAMGIAGGDEPRSLAARPRPPRQRHRMPTADLRLPSRRVSVRPILSPRNSFWARWAFRVVTEVQATSVGEPAISFGPYRLLVAQRLLLEGDKPVRLGGRAFDILTALVERAGEVVSKQELIAQVWPTTFVEEANVKIQVNALRRALGDGQGDNRFVATVVGRGYNFVAPIRRDEPARASLAPTTAPAALHNLPFATTRIIGREDIVTTLVTQLSRRRMVTVVGPGGIGKTTVGLAVAERMIGAQEHGVRLVDLAPLRDPGLVPSAVATVFGLEIRTEDPLPALVAALSDNRMLLMLDSCEHVIDVAASLAEAVLRGTSGVKILATSREPLRVPGEHIHRLGPLSIPEPSPGRTAAEAAAFAAVQLFVERVTAIVEDFALTDANAPLVVAICRRLDGLPLAIEFAAPRVEALGVEGLAARLDDSLRRMLGTQRRAGVPRHRTMEAVVDWSYGLLSEDEQRFFRALGVFAGGFNVQAAATVAMGAATTDADAIDRLADLVAKSLIVADASGTKPRFRLLDTTRAFGLAKLDTSGDHEATARRHAEYYRILFEHAEGEATTRSTDDWLRDCAQEIDNLRAALDWAFSSAGDGSLGVALTNAAFPLWVRLSLLEECRGRTQQALRTFGTGERQDSREQMRLHAALGASTSDPSEMDAALMKTLEIATSLDDIEYQLRALRGLVFRYVSTNPYRALPHAQAFRDLAAGRSDSHDRLFGECLIGAAKHYIGDQAGARRHLEQALSSYPPTEPRREIISFQDIIRFGTELWVMAHVWRGRVLWLQGLADQAVHAAETGIEAALATAHAPSLCYALGLGACQVDLWVGNLDAAEDHTRMLLDHSRKHGLLIWGELGAKFRSVINVKRDKFNSGPDPLPAGQDETFPGNFDFLLLEVTAARWPSPAKPRIDLSEASWLTPELFRLKGERLLARRTSGAAEAAEQLFLRAQDEARCQGALSWELRAATSLAGLLRGQGQSANAIACLQPIYDRFTEGFDTPDLVAAKQLLDELSAPDRG